MTLQEIWNIRYASESLKKRTTAALGKIAQTVIQNAEATQSQKTWAANTLLYATQEAEKAMWFMASNPTIVAAGDASTDQDVEYVATVYYQTVTA